MEEIRIEPVRNIALVSNLGAGKTSLAEALLYTGGAIPSLGTVLQGTTVSTSNRKNSTITVPPAPACSN